MSGNWGPFVQFKNGNAGPAVNPPFQVNPKPYTDPTVCIRQRPSTPHTGIIVVGLCDGSVRTVSAGISPLTWWQACTPAGGEVLGTDW